MEKTLKTIILSTVTAGALALSAGCYVTTNSPRPPHRGYIPQRHEHHPRFNPHPYHHQNRPFHNPTSHPDYRH